MTTGNVMNAVGGEETMTQKRIGFFKELVPNLIRLGMIAPAMKLLIISVSAAVALRSSYSTTNSRAGKRTLMRSAKRL